MRGATWVRGATRVGCGDAVGTGLENYEISYVNGTLTVTAGPASIIVLVSGAEQSGEPSAQLSESLVVLVSDAHGNPTQNVAVTWQATGGAWVSPETTLTDAAGNASVTAYLGPSYDTTYTYTATVEGFPLATSVQAWSVPSSEPDPWEWDDDDEVEREGILPPDPVDSGDPPDPEPMARLWKVSWELNLSFVHKVDGFTWRLTGNLTGSWGVWISRFWIASFASGYPDTLPIRLALDGSEPMARLSGAELDCAWDCGTCEVVILNPADIQAYGTQPLARSPVVLHHDATGGRYLGAFLPKSPDFANNARITFVRGAVRGATRLEKGAGSACEVRARCHLGARCHQSRVRGATRVEKLAPTCRTTTSRTTKGR